MYLIVLTLVVVAETKDIAIDKGCSFSLNYNTPKNALLLQYRTGELLYPYIFRNTIKMARKTKMKVTCGDQEFLYFNTRSLIVACVEDDLVQIIWPREGHLFKLKELECEQFPSSTIRNTSKRCDHRRGALYEIGFQLHRRKFLKIMSVCFDPVEVRVLYSWYEWSKLHLGHQRDVSRPFFAHDNMYTFNVNRAYSRWQQWNTLAKILKSKMLAYRYVRNDDLHFLARGHLTSSADFVYGAEQAASFHYINVAPQWQIFNVGNWQIIESDLRNLQRRYRHRYQVVSGTHGVATLPDEFQKEQKLYLYVHGDTKQLPVPNLFWKIVYDRLNNEGVAIVGVNNPYLKRIPMEYILCNGSCNNIKWLTIRPAEQYNIPRGYIYCCNMDEFLQATGYENLFRHHETFRDLCKDEVKFDGKTSEQILYMMTDSCRYDRWKRPSVDGQPTAVSIRIYIYFIGNVEAQHLQYTTHVLIRYRWVDHRLARNVTYNIQGESLVKERLWTPHVYIVNEHESRIMGSSSQDVLVTVLPDGTVLYSTRLKVTLLCLMNLQKFPFDEQKCPLILESWTYNTDDLTLSWEKISPVVQNARLHMTEYNLISISTNETFTLYSLPLTTWATSEENYHYFGKFTGNYSSLTVYFQLEREFGHYIMDYYVPSILIVAVSWVTFWLDPNAVPGRTTLGTSTLLTFITLSRNTGSSLPKVSYIKATEIWFIGCTIFIFGSLVEFAFVNTIWRRRKEIQLKKVTSKHVFRATLTPQLNRRSISTISSTQSLPSIQQIHENNKRTQRLSPIQTAPSTESICSEPATNCNRININNNNIGRRPSCGLLKMTPQEIAGWIDKRSRVFFPVAFLAFNVFYWIFVWL